ncbi:Hsp20/alpha crystallin family protein [Paenibacillus chartarius]|uniref:Hsp20/alpha crystallin family protein n=1 Tax=Paenibacillus chartarius TaxID=747481 RepID=A0ABV6DG81_9BACL
MMQLDKIKEWMALAEQCGDSDFWTSMMESVGSSAPSVMPGIKSRTAAGWSPAVDIVVSADETIVWAELPGVRRDDLHVSVTRDSVVIRGFKHSPAAELQPYAAERYAGAFERTVKLPGSVSTDIVSAKLQDGVLVVRLKTLLSAEAKVTVE